MTHQYEASCRVEDRGALILDTWLAPYYDLRAATRDEQVRGIDRIAEDGSGPQTIDYKCDERAAATGNAFIETVSNRQTGRPGWALTSEAFWLLYFVMPHEVLVCTFRTIRAQLPSWRERYRQGVAINTREGLRYETLGVLVPLAVVRDVAEYSAQLDHGDAAILETREVDPEERDLG